MDHHEKQLQSVGVCHRLFCYIMKTLAAQALKPVTLGPPVPRQQIQNSIHPRIDRRSTFPVIPNNVDSIRGAEDSESLASIDIEDETSALLDAKGEGWWQDERKVMVETTCEVETIKKAPRKMVSIKDEPEIIYYMSKKRRKNPGERQMSGTEGGIRPLRSILKVGSNLYEKSGQVVREKPVKNNIMYY